MPAKITAVLALACGIALSPAASAFNFGFLRDSVLERLTPEDIEIGTRTTRVALDGASDAEWNNPATGASGFIRVLETIDVDDQKGCRRVRMGVTAGDRHGSGTYLLCRSSKGAWLFYTPEAAAEPVAVNGDGRPIALRPASPIGRTR